MTEKQIANYGTWEATIVADMLTQKARRFGTLKTKGDAIYWCEQRSDEKGRGVLMRWSQQQGVTQILNEEYSARSKVHEYGGGEFCIADDKIYFVNADDQQIYSCVVGQTPILITHADDFRFADLEYDSAQNRLIAVAERHDDNLPGNLPKNMLVYIGLGSNEAGGITILDDSHDFYASPRLGPDQKTLAWLSWDLPHMPWEAASLYISPLLARNFKPKHIAGGQDPSTSQTTASFGPVWDHNGVLYFINDESGTGQLYAFESGEVSLVKHQDPNADSLRPQWVFGMESICTANKGSASESEVFLSSFCAGELCLQHITPKEIGKISTKAKSIDMIQMCGDKLAAVITTDLNPASIALINPADGSLTIIRESTTLDIDKANISKGQLMTFDGREGQVYGLYYPPRHAAFKAPADTLPPAIITVHGGPTGMADRGLKMKTQYWTNRGFAVFEVDYSGSAGYGKPYRERLNGKWGELEVEDTIAAADYLIAEKLADPDKLIITGGSAGGYTALMALVKSDLFKCASCSYPVTDLAQLIEITHKFEFGYSYALTGTTPENAKQKLSSRAVLSEGNEIKAPVIFFQGLDDKVVPPEQPKAVYEVLKSKGIKTALFEFEGEGHGFRKAQTIATVLAEEEAFFLSTLKISN